MLSEGTAETAIPTDSIAIPLRQERGAIATRQPFNYTTLRVQIGSILKGRCLWDGMVWRKDW
jgi:hypothetical protein